MKISSYTVLSNPQLSDKLIGTDVNNMDVTKNFTIESILALGGNAPSYKLYTALVNQSGISDLQGQSDGFLLVGATYYINYNLGNPDFTNVGAPNNNVGTYFVATGTTPNTWGAINPFSSTLTYNTGAPIVTVLANTIGNVWWTYNNTGSYSLKSNGLFNENKTIGFTTLSNFDFDITNAALGRLTNNEITLFTTLPTDGPFNNFNNLAIEVRVYS